MTEVPGEQPARTEGEGRTMIDYTEAVTEALGIMERAEASGYLYNGREIPADDQAALEDLWRLVELSNEQILGGVTVARWARATGQTAGMVRGRLREKALMADQHSQAVARLERARHLSERERGESDSDPRPGH